MKLKVPVLFGRHLVRTGVISEGVLKELARVQDELSGSPAYAALDAGLLSLDQTRAARRHQRERAVSFEQAVRELGLLDEDGLKAVREACAGEHVRLGELLVLRGLISTDDLERELTVFNEEQHARGVDAA